MNNEGLYEFYWKYCPNNYFEQIINYKNQNYNFLIEDGSISLEVNSIELKKDSEIVNSIYDIINCYFITQLIISYRPYLISFESATFGEKNDFFRQKLSFIEKYQNLHTEILPYDQIINTKILASKYKFNDFIELIVRNKSNSILKVIIDLFIESVKYSYTEFSILYKIRDFLEKNIGKDFISKQKRSIFGQYTNTLPTEKSRHFKFKLKDLRETKSEERKEVIEIAREMIHNYLLNIK